jgi:hypothetical protein
MVTGAEWCVLGVGGKLDLQPVSDLPIGLPIIFFNTPNYELVC